MRQSRVVRPNGATARQDGAHDDPRRSAGTPPPAAPRPPEARPRAVAPPDDPGLPALILDRLGPSPLAEDQLIRDLGLAAALVAPVLTDLELDGRVLRQPGGLLALAP